MQSTLMQRLGIIPKMDNIFLEDIRHACKNSIARPGAQRIGGDRRSDGEGRGRFPGWLWWIEGDLRSIYPVFFSGREPLPQCLFFIFPQIKCRVRQVILSRWMTLRVVRARDTLEIYREISQPVRSCSCSEREYFSECYSCDVIIEYSKYL